MLPQALWPKDGFMVNLHIQACCLEYVFTCMIVSAYLNIWGQMDRHHCHYFMFEDAVAQRTPLISFTGIPCPVWMRMVPEQGFSDTVSIWPNSSSWKICSCPLKIPRRESEAALEMWISNSILFENHKHNWILTYLETSPCKKHQDFYLFFNLCFPKIPPQQRILSSAGFSLLITFSQGTWRPQAWKRWGLEVSAHILLLPLAGVRLMSLADATRLLGLPGPSSYAGFCSVNSALLFTMGYF